MDKIYNKYCDPWQGASCVDLHISGDELDIILKALETYAVCQDATKESSKYIWDLLNKVPRKLKIYDEPEYTSECEAL